jgi:hypothetical protein
MPDLRWLAPDQPAATPHHRSLTKRRASTRATGARCPISVGFHLANQQMQCGNCDRATDIP